MRVAGFSLFELVIVICLIALLFAFAAKHYRQPITESQKKVVGFQANTFVRSVETLRALGVAEKTHILNTSDGVYIYLNRHGWPFAAGISNKIPRHLSKDELCASLWDGIFQSVESRSETSNTLAQESFEVTSVNKHICRYKLSRKQEGSFFFDYDVRTGRVDIRSS